MTKKRRPVDPSEWEPDLSSYSLDNFYIAAQDTKGHGNTIHARVPPNIMRAVDELVQSKAFVQLRTSSDFVRDAIHHRLHYLSERNSSTVDSEVNSILRGMRLMQAHIDKLDTLREYKKVIDSAADAINAVSDSKSEQKKLVDNLMSEVSDMPAYWRNRYTQEIKQRFGHLL